MDQTHALWKVFSPMFKAARPHQEPSLRRPYGEVMTTLWPFRNKTHVIVECL